MVEKKWISSDDSYNLVNFQQIEGAWPINQPLPLPVWSSKEKEPLVVDKVWQYEDITAMIETVLQRMLEETHYDTVHNFLDFYKSYKKSMTGKDLRTFYQNYVPPINRRHHMCVSLAMEICNRISDLNPELADHFFLVSCEEAVESCEPYIKQCEKNNIEVASYNLEKEHALLAMNIVVAGHEGVLLLDPGYHIARCVTVMKDQYYPHTGMFLNLFPILQIFINCIYYIKGWFTQFDEPNYKKEYCYTFTNSSNFITWAERSIRDGKQNQEKSLIYVAKPYRTAIDVTVRRNLVYNFRSLISRNTKGYVFAGLYFPVTLKGTDNVITIFYDGPNNATVKIKQLASVFKDVSKIPESVMKHLKNLAPQLRMHLDELIDLLLSISELMGDMDFVKQVLTINTSITVMSADN